MAGEESAVRIDGLREFRSVLRRTDREALKEVQGVLKDAVGIVATEAAALAPRRTGTLAGSIRPYTSGNKAGVRSRLPYSGVVHWGGTISPRGVPITFKRTEFITRAMDRKSDAVLARLAVGFDGAARRSGWK